VYRSLGFRIQGLDPLIVQIQQCFIRLAVGSSNASTTAELLEMYQEWQRVTAAQVSKKQAELGFQIEGVEAVAMKLLQRLNYSASVIKTSAAYLQDG
jgi:hypothetical protein